MPDISDMLMRGFAGQLAMETENASIASPTPKRTQFIKNRKFQSIIKNAPGRTWGLLASVIDHFLLIVPRAV